MNGGEFSPAQMFFQAGAVVQAVFLLLGAASLLCWAVILEKWLVLRGLAGETRRFEAEAEADAVGGPGLAGKLGAAAEDEAVRRHAGERPAETRERIERVLRETLAAALLRAEERLAYLATIASSAPFIGLFGTVWGVMHAFAGIAAHQDTSLAAVAPGIAEALAATAAGLAAAIPAAIAYNKLAGDFGTLSRRLQLAGARLARRLAEGSPASC